MTQHFARRPHGSPYAGVMPRNSKKMNEGMFKRYLNLGLGAMFCLACIKFLFYTDPMSLEQVQGFQNQTMVEFHTSQGKFTVELFPKSAPKTVAHFLKLVESGFYNDNSAGFYRNERHFTIQGGGFIHGNKAPDTSLPVEYNLPSTERTVVLARSSNPLSGNSEFAVMLTDNSLINSPDGSNPGFTTFGRVFEGWNTILKITDKLPDGFLSKEDKDKAIMFDRANIVSRGVPTDSTLKRILEIVKDHIGKEYRAVVFSKTFCPYCRKVKQILTTMKASFDVVELDTLQDGPLYQDALEYLTGRRTVPNVFVGGVSIGGGDDTEQLYQSGKLEGILQKAGVLAMSYTRQLTQENACVVFSKSYCPHCAKAKEAISSLHAKMVVVELDEREDGPAIQSALVKITGQRTVPNVFIGGKSIGGGDNTVRMKESGELEALLNEAGALK